MVQYSKSILASLFFAAAFNFSAHAGATLVSVGPNSGNEQSTNAQRLDAVLQSNALSTAVMDKQQLGFDRLLALETETQKWPAKELGIALQFAAQYHQWDMLETLLDKKADVISVEDKSSALATVAISGSLKFVESLHKAGAKVSASDDRALRYAAEQGHLDVVKYLMENGADAVNKEKGCLCGNPTALRQAAFWNHMSVVQYMVEEQHVPLNSVREDGVVHSEVLEDAFYSGNPYMAEYLFDHGAIALDNGGSGLAGAVRKGDTVMMRLALSHGMTLTNTYRYFEAHQDVQAYVEGLATLKRFMAENNIALPAAATSNPAPSP